MTKKQRYEAVIAYFSKAMPEAKTELHYQTPFELLVAVMLSAQCTDKRINQVTPALFQAFPTPQALAQATPEAVFEYIHSVSYPNNKARHLVAMARMLVERYGGEVPPLGEDLEKLPGGGARLPMSFRPWCSRRHAWPWTPMCSG